MIETTVTATW